MWIALALVSASRRQRDALPCLRLASALRRPASRHGLPVDTGTESRLMARRDDLTLDLPGVARRRGRPATGKAKTGAQRQKAYRQRQKQLASRVTEIQQ